MNSILYLQFSINLSYIYNKIYHDFILYNYEDIT